MASPTLINSYAPERRSMEDPHSTLPQVTDMGPFPEPVLGSSYGPYAYLPKGPHEAAAAAQGPPAYQSPERRKILGLSRTLFWVLAAVFIIMVLGVALGAGIGVGLSQQHANSSSNDYQATRPSTSISAASATSPSTPSSSDTAPPPSSAASSSSTSTSSAPVTSGTTGLAANDCGSITNQPFYTPDGTEFAAFCDVDWPAGNAATGGNGTVTDLFIMTVYTFEACMDLCATYNAGIVDGQTPCGAVAYNSNLTQYLESWRGNCFLKDKKAENGDPKGTTAACAVLVS